MTFGKTVATGLALVLATGTNLPAMAQGAASPARPPVAAPTAPVESWSAVANTSRPAAQIGKTATDGVTRFSGGCSQLAGPGFSGRIVGYSGGELQAVDGQSERVIMEVRGAEWREVFAAQLRYNARDRSWELANTLAPIFVSSFSRGGTLTVLNSQWRPVVAFDLTGSTNAARIMREACGFQ